MAYVNPRVQSFSQYLLSDDKPAQGQPRRALRRLRVRPAALQRARRSRPTPPSGCRSRPRPTGAPTSSGAACGRRRPGPRSRSSPRARKGRPFKPLRTVTTNHRGVFGLRAQAPRQAALPRAVDRAGRQGLARPADPRHLNPSARGCVGRSVRRAVPFAILAGCLGVGVLPALAADRSVAIFDVSLQPVAGRGAAGRVGDVAGRRGRPSRTTSTSTARSTGRRAERELQRHQAVPRSGRPTATAATCTRR